MGHPRRNSMHKQSPSSDSSAPPQSPFSKRQPTASSQNLGMSPASRYQHNLKVLRRRDPSILSIFDQFSHVCLYHHNGTKWEKHGYEGSMFLYERDTYPPYGFYILNRMGMEDHIQRLYPEDNIVSHSSYLIIRSFPEFTARRLASARASAPENALDKFSNIFVVPNVDKLTPAEKGESQTIGLWMFITDSREPLFDVFNRLHYFIKQNLPYPQEFRYTPDNPPPSNISFHLSVTHPTHSDHTAQEPSTTIREPPSSAQETQRPQPVNGSNMGISELDKLFAKIETPTLSAATTAGVQSQTTHVTPASKMTVETLFATFGGQENNKSVSTSSSSVPPRPPTSSTGIRLLDDIFASAHASKPLANQPQISNNGVLPASIHSPAPTMNDVPQILSQDVISTLMGLPPSRTASAASSTYSVSAQSHPSSREGDNEDESDHGIENLTSDGAYFESSTILDAEAKPDEYSAGAFNCGRPSFVDKRTASTGHLSGEFGRNQGDVTPRAPHPLNGFVSSPPFSRQNTKHSLPPSLMSTCSNSTVTAGPAGTSHAKFNARPLVPFESDSELWPYSSGGNVRINGIKAETESDDGDDSDEVLELDFEDTSALSDPDTFKKGFKARNRKKYVDPGPENRSSHNRGKMGKDGRGERAARVRQEIEDSWDVPEYMKRSETGQTTSSRGNPSVAFPDLHKDNVYSPRNGIVTEERVTTGETTDEDYRKKFMRHTSPRSSPSLSPTSTPAHAQESIPTFRLGKAPERRATVKAAAIDSTVNGAVSSVKQSQNCVVDVNGVRESLVSTLITQGSIPPRLGKNDFVREVLALIHMDKTFVESLWKDYTCRMT